jgi:ribonucleoside-diphosphate reductase alpha chain
LAGEYIIVNKHLLKDLVSLGLWNDDLKNKLIAANGSVANINEIPDNLKALYKTAWELSQKSIIEMAADRGAFICQSQSLNVFVENPNFGKLSSMHFYAWERGLKTGMYYLRTKAATDAIKFTVDKKYQTTEVPDEAAMAAAVEAANAPAVPEFEVKGQMTPEEMERQAAALACSLDNPDACEMCSG